MVRVKMTENTNIICQRFSQNAWKKDLCSNCFKSKEEHELHVHVPPPFRYRPILNFPQQGILKESNGKRTGNQTESKDKPRTRVVSFQTTETEIIGYGGADDCQYSSSDDDNEYCSIPNNVCDSNNDDYANNYSSISTGTTNEDELEFRKLTRSNTDFNSVTANLTVSDDQNAKTSTVVRKPYVDLKLGKPLVDGQGCKRTLQVTIEPFNSCARLASPKTVVAKSGLDPSKTNTVNTSNVKIDQSEKSITTQNGDLSTTDGNRRSNSPTLKSPTEDKIVVMADEDRTKTTNSAIVLQSSPSKTDDIESHRRECEARIDTLLRPVSSATKDSNPICLPLIACKALDIEFDQPGSRELVGEPDGKADSDDSYEQLQSPLSSLDDRANAASIVGVDNEDVRKTTIAAAITTAETTAATTIDNNSAATKISPQRSFLHNVGNVNTDVGTNSKEDIASLSSSSSVESLSSTRQATLASVSTFTGQTTPSTPRATKLPTHCNSGGGPGGSSTKRPAPKPPSPKISTPSTAFAFAQNRRHNRSSITAETDYCESPLMSGTRDAISFLTGTTRMATDTKRRASLYEYFDSPISCPPPSNRNSLNFCSLTPDKSVGRLCTLRRYSTALNDSRPFDADTERRWPSYSVTDTTSMCSGTVRIRKYDSPARKCARSLSYDNIPTPSTAFTLSPKTTAIASKYSVATIKVKSTLRRFLRFNINNTGSTRITNDVHERRRSSRSDLSAIAKAFSTSSSSSSSTPTKTEPRQRPVIIHPIDLNKSPVEIVTMSAVCASLNSSEKTENKTVDKAKQPSTVPSSNSSGVIYATPTSINRPTKPPPPPRTQSLDHCKYSSPNVTSGDNGTGSDKATGTGSIGTTKPTRPPRPPPPKTPTKNTPGVHPPTHPDSPLYPEIYVNITPKVNS